MVCYRLILYILILILILILLILIVVLFEWTQIFILIRLTSLLQFETSNIPIITLLKLFSLRQKLFKFRSYTLYLHRNFLFRKTIKIVVPILIFIINQMDQSTTSLGRIFWTHSHAIRLLVHILKLVRTSLI